jgi:hypothetical protein
LNKNGGEACKFRHFQYQAVLSFSIPFDRCENNVGIAELDSGAITLFRVGAL